MWTSILSILGGISEALGSLLDHLERQRIKKTVRTEIERDDLEKHIEVINELEDSLDNAFSDFDRVRNETNNNSS